VLVQKVAKFVASISKAIFQSIGTGFFFIIFRVFSFVVVMFFNNIPRFTNILLNRLATGGINKILHRNQFKISNDWAYFLGYLKFCKDM